MGARGGMAGLAEAIGKAVRMAKKGRPAERGVVSGGGVTIGTKTYPARLVVDMNIQDGDWVYCQVTDDDTRAIIIGA